MVKKQRRKTKQRAKVYKNSAVVSLSEITVLGAYISMMALYTTHEEKSTYKAPKATKIPFLILYVRIIDNEYPNISALRPLRAYIVSRFCVFGQMLDHAPFFQDLHPRCRFSIFIYIFFLIFFIFFITESIVYFIFI